MYERFTDSARMAMASAAENARSVNSSFVSELHLLFALGTSERNIASHVLNEMCRFSVDHVVQTIQRLGSEEVENVDKPVRLCWPLNDALEVIVGQAMEEARNLNQNFVGSEHLLLAIAWSAEKNPEDELAEELREANVSPGDLREYTLRALGIEVEFSETTERVRMERLGQAVSHCIQKSGGSKELVDVLAGLISENEKVRTHFLELLSQRSTAEPEVNPERDVLLGSALLPLIGELHTSFGIPLHESNSFEKLITALSQHRLSPGIMKMVESIPRAIH